MRKDYEIILNLIPENSKVLDIGCSDGELITYLENKGISAQGVDCLLYTSPSPRDLSTSRMPSSA